MGSKHPESSVNQKVDVNKMFSIALKRLWKCLQKPLDPLLQTDFQSLCGDFTSGTITDNVPNKGVGGGFFFSAFHLDICEINHCRVMWNETTGERSLGRSGLCLIPFEPWGDSFAVRTQATQ